MLNGSFSHTETFDPTGYIPSWSIPWQKQGLCCSRTSSSFRCLQVLFCGKPLSPITWGRIKAVQVLIYWYPLQGKPDFIGCRSLLKIWRPNMRLQNTATTSSFNGNPEHNRATLHQMCKAQRSFETWNIWELQCVKPVKMWGKLVSNSSLPHISCTDYTRTPNDKFLNGNNCRRVY